MGVCAFTLASAYVLVLTVFTSCQAKELSLCAWLTPIRTIEFVCAFLFLLFCCCMCAGLYAK